MKQPKKIWLVVICLLWIGVSVFGVSGVQAKAMEKESIENAKTGIVEIFSGFNDNKGNFIKLQSGSGFLVRNTDNETYIITNRSIVTISDSDKKEYCKDNKIKIDGNVPETIIKIIVKGDVSVVAELVTESIEKNFCILSTANVVNEKKALKMENSRVVEPGDVVYAMGFPDKENLAYSSTEVECNLGTIEEATLNENDSVYIQHTAYVSEGCIGGPLLNETGYVVGINCKKILENGIEIFCTLPIAEILEVLDNFSIYYESSLREQWNIDLEQLYMESTALYESKDYKKESLEQLQLVLSDIDKLREKSPEEVEIEKLEQEYMELQEAKNTLIPKMEKIQLAIYIIAGLIAVLFIRLMMLVILNVKDKKNEMKMSDRANQHQTHLVQLEKEPIEKMENEQVSLRQMQSEQSHQKKDKLSLINPRTGYVKEISTIEMLVGKSQQRTDFSISDNKMISRIHATFQQKNGKYYVCDLGSTNGTFINGRKIEKDIYEEIKAGDKILLADEKFEVI